MSKRNNISYHNIIMMYICHFYTTTYAYISKCHISSSIIRKFYALPIELSTTLDVNCKKQEWSLFSFCFPITGSTIIFFAKANKMQGKTVFCRGAGSATANNRSQLTLINLIVSTKLLVEVIFFSVRLTYI